MPTRLKAIILVDMPDEVPRENYGEALNNIVEPGIVVSYHEVK